MFKKKVAFISNAACSMCTALISALSEDTKSMTEEGPLGVAVVGEGTMALVYAQHLSECIKYDGMSRLRLMAYVSRIEFDIENVPRLTLEEVTTKPDIHMIIISTPNYLHEEVARKCILAKKHVFLDSPMTLTSSSTKNLFRLARDNGVACCEADVSLVAPPYRKLKEEVTSRIGTLKDITMQSIEVLKDGTEDMVQTGPPFTSSIDVLHTVLDMLGDLTPVEACVRRTFDEVITTAKLLTIRGVKPITLHIAKYRTPTELTGKSITAIFNDGKQLHSTLPLSGKLDKYVYVADLEMFTETILGQCDGTERQWLSIRALELADQLNFMAKLHPNSLNFS